MHPQLARNSSAIRLTQVHELMHAFGYRREDVRVRERRDFVALGPVKDRNSPALGVPSGA